MWQEGFEYVLTSRLQTDLLECRFAKSRQMSGGRFLVGLREFTTSERILAIKSFLKESYSIWEEDMYCSIFHECKFENFLLELDGIIEELDASKLDHESSEEIAVIRDYIAKKLIKRSLCEGCKNLLVLSKKQSPFEGISIPVKAVSRRALLPSLELVCYAAKDLLRKKLCKLAIYFLRANFLNKYPQSTYFSTQPCLFRNSVYCNRII